MERYFALKISYLIFRRPKNSVLKVSQLLRSSSLQFLINGFLIKKVRVTLFWKYSDKFQRCLKPKNLSFRNMKSFQPSILIKKSVFPTTKVEVNKPDLRLIYLRMEMQGRIQTFLVTEDVIVNLSPVFKRLEEKKHTEMFSVANSEW